MDIKMPHDNVTALRAACEGYMMEHGMYPDFVLMSADIARSIFAEVKANSKYSDLIKIGGDLQPMKLNIGVGGIEIGQVVGSGRVELVADPAVMKARRSI